MVIGINPIFLPVAKQSWCLRAISSCLSTNRFATTSWTPERSSRRTCSTASPWWWSRGPQDYLCRPSRRPRHSRSPRVAQHCRADKPCPNYSMMTHQICNNILDPCKILEEDLLYRKSLVVEPQTARLSVTSIPPPMPQLVSKGSPLLSHGQTLSKLHQDLTRKRRSYLFAMHLLVIFEEHKVCLFTSAINMMLIFTAGGYPIEKSTSGGGVKSV